jgi:hypothetical protein
MKKTALAIATLAAATLAGSPATAQDPASAAPAKEGGKEFGNPGVLAIGAITGLTLAYSNVSPPQGTSNSGLTFALSPQLAYFVTEGLSLGGEVGIAYTKVKDDSVTIFSLGPRVGYNAWITPGSLSIWPQIGVNYASTSTSVSNQVGGASASFTGSLFTLVAFVPLLIHPAKHFHFGIGPYFTTDVSSSNSSGGTSVDGDKTTTVGIRGEIGGWL